MIELTRGNLLDADADALVNTVNCVGVMGRGIAAQFKRAFPAMFKNYAAACKRGEVQPGKMHVVEVARERGAPNAPRFIINFPTKRHWQGNSRMDDIDAGLAALVEDVKRLGIQSIAIPPLGCGLGGLDWADVRPRIERAFAALPDVRVLVFEPTPVTLGAPSASRLDVAPNFGAMLTAGRAAMVGLVERYLAGFIDPFATLLEVHKLMYFMQEAGEPLKLTYKKGPFGPYAQNLRHVLAKTEGHLLMGYEDGGDQPNKPLSLVPGASEAARAFLEAHPDTRARFDRVADLVEGYESTFGMELLATVHWVAAHEGALEREAVVAAVHRWSARKKRLFSDRQILVAWDILNDKGWLTGGAKPSHEARHA